MTSPGGGAVTIGALVFGVFSWVMVSGGLTFPVANPPPGKDPPPGVNPPLDVGVVNFGGDVEFAVELALTPPELPFTVGASVTNPQKSRRLLLPHSHGDLVVVLFEGVVLLPFGLEV